MSNNNSDNKEIKVALDADDLIRLDAMVANKKEKGEKISRSSLVRRAVKDYLNKNSNAMSIGG